MKPRKQESQQRSRSSLEEYDLLMLGCGTGGKLLAWTLAKAGMKVAAIEREYVGGACVNIACMPSKNVIYSAQVASYFRRSKEFGISKENWKLSMPAVRERKRQMVGRQLEKHLQLFAGSGAELIMGSGRFVEPKTLEVTSPEGTARLLHGQRVVLNLGTHATIAPTPGLREAKPLTHIEALELDYIPEHLLILGGGYVGAEFAQAMRRFGSRITVIEHNPRLLHREDEDISSGLQELFRDEGIEVLTNTRITRVEGKSGEAVKLTANRDGAELLLEGTDILVAAGRTPNTEGIGLDLAGVETTAPEVCAVGECAGSPHFTHISENDFHIVHDNILGGRRATTGRQVPFCLFTDPEFARVGLSEREAKEQGVAYRLAKIPMSAVLRAQALTELRGFMKALIDTGSDRILGLQRLRLSGGRTPGHGARGDAGRLPYTALRDAIFSHPTMPEGLIMLFDNVPAVSAPVSEEQVLHA